MIDAMFKNQSNARHLENSMQLTSQRLKRHSVTKVLVWVTVFSVLWWVITQGDIGSWLIGLPAVVGASWARIRIGSFAGTRISLLGLVRFVPYFLWESLRGGTDVALRTLAPRVRVKPGFYRYRTGLHASSARTFFAYCVSLLPGTLTAELQDEWLEIHTLNNASEPFAELVRLERVIARLFEETGDRR